VTFGTNGTGTVTVTPPNGATWTKTAATWDGWGFVTNGTWRFDLAGTAVPTGTARFTVSGFHAGTEADPEVFSSPDAPAICGRDGLVFTLSGIELGQLKTSGYGVTDLGGGRYRLDAGAEYCYDNPSGVAFAYDARATSYTMNSRAEFANTPPFTFGTNSAGTVTVRPPNGATWTKTAATWDGWGFVTNGTWRFTITGALPSSPNNATFTVSGIHAGTAEDPEVFTAVGDPQTMGRDGLVFMVEVVTLDDLDTTGYGVTYLGVDGSGRYIYRLDAGAAYDFRATAATPASLDTRQEGPNRKAKYVWELPPVAYTADDWAYSSSAAVTLTFESRHAATITHNLNGSGGVVFEPPVLGPWTATMSVGGSSQSAIIFISPGGLMSIFK